MTQKRPSKRLGAFCAALLLSTALTATAQAALPSVTVDGAAYKGPVLVQQNTAYIPLRNFLSPMGWSISWDSASGTARARKADRTVVVDPTRQTVTADGTVLNTKAEVRSERIYLPLRSLCDALGYAVHWDSEGYAIAVGSGTSADWTEEDLYWLSRIICAEAGGESMTGQIAVGNVVLNRVASPEFPNSIHAVIFDRKYAVQFEPVSNGTVYRPPTAKSVEAAKLALQGVNTAGSSLYFFSPSLSEGTWIVNHRDYLKTIGCHRFYL